MPTTDLTGRSTSDHPQAHLAQDPDAATAPLIDSNAIDSKALLSRCMENIPFAISLLREMEVSAKQQVDAIALHASRHEQSSAAEVAHSLKGAAAIIGAEPLRGKAAVIEAVGSDCTTSLLLELVLDLQGEMDRCLRYIPILLADLQQRSLLVK